MKRVYNFYAGPATLPLPILEKAASELTDYKDSGMSIMELSHRSKPYDAVHTEAINNIRELYKVPDNYKILFLQGGASTQFFMAPMNFIGGGESADYILTGAWSQKALKEAEILGKKTNVIATSKESNFDRIPKDFNFTKGASYVHITTNNTIFGTQFQSLPETNGIPLVIDASSDIFSYAIDWKNVGVLYAGAQKNAGPSGIAIVIIREDLCADRNQNIPTMLKYSTHVENNSLYNTPPTFSIYMINLNLQWLKSNDGISAMAKINKNKAQLIYNVIDESNGYYKGHAQKDSRSLMNITFNLGTPELEEKFVKEATAKDFIGLKGHRSVGGIRASVYNAMPVEGCEKLATFMKEFMKNN